MTRGQIAQLQDLSKCYMPYKPKRWVKVSLDWSNDPAIRMTKWDKADLRRLTHLYRHQIAAVKRNQTR